MMAGSESISLEDAALYTVEERLETFKIKHCGWPFDSGPCTPLKMAEAGFYYCGSPEIPDWVRCFVCHQDMDGWEDTDIPLVEHKSHQPKCAFLKIKDPYAVTVGDVLDLEKAAISNFLEIERSKLETDMRDAADEAREEVIELITNIKDQSTVVQSIPHSTE